jgi:recombination protein RecA
VTSIASLRQQLAAVIAPPVAAGDGLPTGIAALDGALSGGGIPRGRLTELVGAPGSGKTTVVRELVAQALGASLWVAYIDATRTLSPADWAPLAGDGRLWIVRPPAGTSAHAPWCADVLLRSGTFGLVVLDGGPALTHAVAVRLTRLARESHAAFVVLRDDDLAGRALTGGAVRIRVSRRSRKDKQRSEERDGRSAESGADGRHDPRARWRTIGRRLALAAGSGSGRSPAPGAGRGDREGPRAPGTGPPAGGMLAAEARIPSARRMLVLTLTVEKGGTHHPVEVGCAIDVARRLCAHPAVPDRRGVAPRNRRGERAAPDAPGMRRTAAAADAAEGERGAGNATLQHKRRCAEPAIGRDGFLFGPGEPGGGDRGARPGARGPGQPGTGVRPRGTGGRRTAAARA